MISTPIRLAAAIRCALPLLFLPVLAVAQDDPRQRDPDITLAREKLGWEPHTTLEQGLEKTVAYFRGIVSGHRDGTGSANPLAPPLAKGERGGLNGPGSGDTVP